MKKALLFIPLRLFFLALFFWNVTAVQLHSEESDGVRWFRPVEEGLGRLSFDVEHDRRGLIFVANENGVFEYDGSLLQQVPLPEGTLVTAMMNAEDGYLYLGGEGVIGHLAPDAKGRIDFIRLWQSQADEEQGFLPVLKIFSLDSGKIGFLFEHRLMILEKGEFRILTSNGFLYDAVFNGQDVYLLDSDSGLMKLSGDVFEAIPGGNFFRAHAMIPLPENKLLLLTRDKGALVYDASKALKPGQNPDGAGAFQPLRLEGAEVLRNRIVSTYLSFDQQRHLVALVGAGLFEINLRSMSMIPLNPRFGIQDEEIYRISMDQRGGVWFATSNGVSSVFPFHEIASPAEKEKKESPAFASLIRGMQTIAEDLDLFEGTFFEKPGGVPSLLEYPSTFLILPYEQNALRFLYEANDMHHPEKLKFQTYLEGLEEGWSKWSERRFREYTNLSWRDYRFHVRAQRADGTTSEASTYSFRILPPWYETWWFYASQVGFLLFLLVLAGVVRGYGWGENLSDYIIAVVVLVMFVYLDTQTEVYIEGFAEDVLYIKVLLMVGMGLMIEPLQHLTKRGFARIHIGGDPLLRRYQDELTELGDRIYFVKNMEKAIAKARKKPRPISLILFDFDHFKKINDDYGLECGDAMLVQLANIMRRNARDGDILARYMGEKFIIGLFDLTSEITLHVCERLRHDIENHEFTHDEHKIHLTASFGGARYPDVCAEELSLEALLDEVDEALTEAKERGRNQSVVAPVIKEAA